MTKSSRSKPKSSRKTRRAKAGRFSIMKSMATIKNSSQRLFSKTIKNMRSFLKKTDSVLARYK